MPDGKLLLLDEVLHAFYFRSSSAIGPELPEMLIQIGNLAVSAKALMTHFCQYSASVVLKGHNSLEGL